MDCLCQHCPKLKYLYLSQECDVGAIERISVKDLKPLPQRNMFHNLESIRMYYYGTSFLESTKQQSKYIRDYLLAKCPKINEIVINLATEPELDENPAEDNLLYDISISICSASYVNFYLKDSCLVEEKVTLRNQNDSDND